MPTTVSFFRQVLFLFIPFLITLPALAQNYTPPLKVDPINNVLAETSGLQMAADHLWSFNDSGNEPLLYRMDTVTNAILQTVRLEGATNVDWEDIAFDGTYFYIGDFGNNLSGDRTDLVIYKFPLHAIPAHQGNPVVTVSAGLIEKIFFQYSDQVPVVTSAANNTRFDCEAMLIDEGKIHLFSKNWVDITTTHYVINNTSAGTYLATAVETMNTNYLVTGADKAAGSGVVVLLGYQTTGAGNHFIHLLYGYTNGLFFNGGKTQVNLPDASKMGQAEGIAFRTNSYGYISNEKLETTVLGFPVTIHQRLRSFDIAAYLPGGVLPITLQHFRAIPHNEGALIRWAFSAQIAAAEVQYSTDPHRFQTIHTMLKPEAGSFWHHPTTSKSYYRMAWKEGSNQWKYSAVSYVEGKAAQMFSHIRLQKDGILLLTNNSRKAGNYTIVLYTTEGNKLAELSHYPIIAGANRLQFSQGRLPSTVVLYMEKGKEQSACLLYVE